MTFGAAVQLIQWNVYRTGQLPRFEFPRASHIHQHGTVLQMLACFAAGDKPDAFEHQKRHQNNTTEKNDIPIHKAIIDSRRLDANDLAVVSL